MIKIETVRKKGAVALTTVLLMVAILVVGGITVSLLGINLTFRAKNFKDHFVARTSAQNCLEQSLFTISFDFNFTGPLSYMVGDFECYSTVSNVPSFPLYKQIDIHSIYKDINFYDTKTADISVNPILIVE